MQTKPRAERHPHTTCLPKHGRQVMGGTMQTKPRAERNPTPAFRSMDGTRRTQARTCMEETRYALIYEELHISYTGNGQNLGVLSVCDCRTALAACEV